VTLPLTRNQRRAKAWKDSEPERLAQVAVCPKCPTWFKTTDERNAHRAAEHPRPGDGLARATALISNVIDGSTDQGGIAQLTRASPHDSVFKTEELR
jgi:hypothetical protein